MTMTNSLSPGKPPFSSGPDKRVGGRFPAPACIIVGMAAKDPWNVEIAARLRAAMAEAEVDTVERLADMLNEPASRIRNWANGTSRPMAADARRLKVALGVTMDWLYEGDSAGLPQGKYIRLMGALTRAQATEPEEPAPARPVVRASRRRVKAVAT